jgi:outer membrane protein OmpA-like peptidoglycan-associated protein
MKKVLLLLVSVAFLATGCGVKEHKKTAIGTGVGAAAGAGIGAAVGGGKGALIGAGVGAVAGGVIGYLLERQEKDFKRELAASEAASVEREKRVIEETKAESAQREEELAQREEELAQREEGVAQREQEVAQLEQEVLVLNFKSDLWFDSNSAVLKSGAQSELTKVATVLNKYPNTKIQIEGHTDNVGSETSNITLSEKRATAVKDALTDKGVDASRMQTIGFGGSKPVADNTTAEGRQTNRRVEIVIVPSLKKS